MVLLRVTLAFLIMFLLPDLYLYCTYLRNIRKQWIKRLFWIPTILLLFALPVVLMFHNAYREITGTFLIICLCVAIPEIVFTLCSLFIRFCGWVAHRSFIPYNYLTGKKIEVALCSLASVVSFIYVVFGAVAGKENFQVREVIFSSSDLPDSFDGYRILQISDLHTGSWTGNSEALLKAMELCNGLNPDLAVFTGDLVNNFADEVKEFMPVLSQLRAKDGVYSILGNHDYAMYTHWSSEAEYKANMDSLISQEGQMGWHMLNNDHTIIRRGNDSIALVGVENSGNPPFPNKGNLPKAMQGTEGMFKVLLSHDPTHWRREVLPETDIQLMLAGHTHDMQISLFGFSPSRFIYPEHNGLYLEKRRGLYVNIGLGYVLFPMRLGAWPEITVITLRKSK